MTDFNNSFDDLNRAGMGGGEADCEALWELLSAYADGLLELDDSLRVEKHVSACDACALDLRFMRETSVLLANTPEVAPPPGLQQAILAATIYRPTWQQRLRESIRYWLVPSRSLTFAGSAAAIVAVAFLSYRALEPMNNVLPPSLTAPHLETTAPASGPDPLVAKNNTATHVPVKISPLAKPVGGAVVAANTPASGLKSGNATTSLPPIALPVRTPSEGIRIVPTSATRPNFGPKLIAGLNAPKQSPLQRHTTPLKTGPMAASSVQPSTRVPDMMTVHKDEMPTVEPAMMVTELKKMPDKMMDMMDTTRATMPPTPNRDIAVAAPVATAKTVALTVKPETTGMRLDSIASLRAELRRKNETPRVIAVDMGSASHSDLLNLVKTSF